MVSTNVTVSLLLLRKHVTKPAGSARARRLIRRLAADGNPSRQPAEERTAG